MNILFIGAHTDDIELGALGSFHFLSKSHNLTYLSLSRCTDLPRNKGKILHESNQVKRNLSELGAQVIMRNFRNRFFGEESHDIREFLENTKEEFNPSVVFTHWENDVHQDHQVVTSEVKRVFKNSTLLGYECLSSCFGFSPNFYIPISKEDLDYKLNTLSLYVSQKGLPYFTSRSINSLAVVRGSEIREGYAEGFHLMRGIWRNF